VPTVQPAYGPKSARPVAPPRRRPRRDGPPPEPAAPADEPKIPDPEHDPHSPPVAGLPVSVLIGLALLPFAIPLLWWAAPLVTGQKAALSPAVPISLAFAASVLCLGVIYTIDWTAATRVKGVLMLVGLAYLTAAGLFFLKKNMLDRVRDFVEPESPWHVAICDEEQFRVQLRGSVSKSEESPLPGVKMAGLQSTFVTHAEDKYHYLAMAGKPARPPQSAEAWYDAVGAHLATTGQVTDQRDEPVGNHPGRQWTVTANEGVRVVRAAVVEGRVYYLSVEGRNVTPDDPDTAEPFFRKFEILPPPAKLKR
jgi:hypothetical protein